MVPIGAVIDGALQFVTIVVLIHILLSWLVGYRVISPNRPWVNALHGGLAKALAPVLQPIRRISPNTGEVDLSPVVLIVFVLAVRYAIKLYPLW